MERIKIKRITNKQKLEKMKMGKIEKVLSEIRDIEKEHGIFVNLEVSTNKESLELAKEWVDISIPTRVHVKC